MTFSFVSYFFQFLTRARTRQGLLFLAVLGLIISSFALIVLQSTMGGLQSNQMDRSVAILGTGVIEFESRPLEEIQDLESKLTSRKILYHTEYELEVLIKADDIYSPLKVHGVLTDTYLSKTKRTFDELIIGRDLAYRMGLVPGQMVTIISPGHTFSLFDDIPNSISVVYNNYFQSDVVDVDQFHGFINLKKVQNLTRKPFVNRIRIFSQFNKNDLIKLINDENFEVFTWKDKNKTLVKALNLESTVMVFLFSAMTLLISLCIMSALMIFFNKIKVDLTGMFILGGSPKSIFKSFLFFLNVVSFSSVFFGITIGVVFLYLLDSYAGDIMPAVFVDQKIPVKITYKGLGISFFIPFFISSLFSYFTLRLFRKDIDFVKLLRT